MPSPFITLPITENFTSNFSQLLFLQYQDYIGSVSDVLKNPDSCLKLSEQLKNAISVVLNEISSKLGTISNKNTGNTLVRFKTRSEATSTASPISLHRLHF